MMCIDWLTEITGYPVCLATRSAVRCRVPDSSVWIAGSGMRCTLARTIRMPSEDSTTAPSILHSSRSRVAENSMSSGKPPVHNDSTVRSWPSTISAPVRPRRIRSSPSRNTVPGAISASVARNGSVLAVPPAQLATPPPPGRNARPVPGLGGPAPPVR